MLRILLAPMRVFPESLHVVVATVLANHLLRGQPLARRLAEVNGKVVMLKIEDLSIELCIRIVDGRLHPAPNSIPDVTIRGRQDAFISLLLRQEDPDTLFFQRRLSVVGDTEIGVHVKNLIDAFDYDISGHFNAVLPPVLARTATRLAGIATSCVRAGMRVAQQNSSIPGRPRQ